MSQVLGTFGLLDFTMLWALLSWHAFLKRMNHLFLQFSNFFSGCGKPRITETAGVGGQMYLYVKKSYLRWLQYFIEV
jgi:hypothetical protein